MERHNNLDKRYFLMMEPDLQSFFHVVQIISIIFTPLDILVSVACAQIYLDGLG